jgi:hypothetical protein
LQALHIFSFCDIFLGLQKGRKGSQTGLFCFEIKILIKMTEELIKDLDLRAQEGEEAQDDSEAPAAAPAEGEEQTTEEGGEEAATGGEGETAPEGGAVPEGEGTTE